MFKRGDIVDSIAIGRAPRFRGKIVFAGVAVDGDGAGESYFHVRDRDGKLWHRTCAQLRPAPLFNGPLRGAEKTA